MTSVYGVTYIGARDQIKRRLKERGSIADDAELFGCACYAAKVNKIWYMLLLVYGFKSEMLPLMWECSGMSVSVLEDFILTMCRSL